MGQIYHVDLRQAAWFSALPWAMMAVLGYVAGAISDMLIQSGRSVTFTRKVMQVLLVFISCNYSLFCTEEYLSCLFVISSGAVHL